MTDYVTKYRHFQGNSFCLVRGKAKYLLTIANKAYQKNDFSTLQGLLQQSEADLKAFLLADYTNDSFVNGRLGMVILLLKIEEKIKLSWLKELIQSSLEKISANLYPYRNRIIHLKKSPESDLVLFYESIYQLAQNQALYKLIEKLKARKVVSQQINNQIKKLLQLPNPQHLDWLNPFLEDNISGIFLKPFANSIELIKSHDDRIYQEINQNFEDLKGIRTQILGLINEDHAIGPYLKINYNFDKQCQKIILRKYKVGSYKRVFEVTNRLKMRYFASFEAKKQKLTVNPINEIGLKYVIKEDKICEQPIFIYHKSMHDLPSFLPISKYDIFTYKLFQYQITAKEAQSYFIRQVNPSAQNLEVYQSKFEEKVNEMIWLDILITQNALALIK